MIAGKTYTTLTIDERESFYAYLKLIATDKSLAADNMWDDDWQNNTHTLPYLLENTTRFANGNGEFYILFDGINVVACGGVYRSQFNENVAIAGVRTWTDSKYRHLSVLREFMLPLHKDWAIKHGIKIVALSFNEYNKNLIQVFKRKRLGETIDRINTREPKHLFYNGLMEVPFAVNVQRTKQWVIYESIDTSFQFDWKTIEYI